MNVSLQQLMRKLDEQCRGALEAAAGLCLTRTNYDVDIEHLFLKLLDVPDSDFSAILKRFEIDASRLTRDLTRALDRLKTGNARTPALSPNLPRLMQNAWLMASVDYGSPRIRSGHLVTALLNDDDLARLARDLSTEFNAISPEALKRELVKITADTAEEKTAPVPSGPATAAAGQPVAVVGTKALDQFTIDLTARARASQIDPVLGRDFEIRQLIDILTRRRQNNPILTGEAGVGKTAVVEGFALRIVSGDVPEPLKNVVVRTLDLGLLQAGAGIKGEFENRLKSVIEEVKGSPQPIILFIDEAHTMIGAGGQAGGSDAANLLKPALARGELRTIAATTWAEYKKYFEKDAALARRFQVVKVEEPTEPQGVAMIRGLSDTLEHHHNVRVLDEAVEAAVKLSHRYMTGRQLPDKAVSVLDTACARVAIGQAATPPPVEDAQRRIAQISVEIGALERESSTGADHHKRLAELGSARTAEEQRLAQLTEQWEKERQIINQIRHIRGRLESEAVVKNGKSSQTSVSGRPQREELVRLNEQLASLQGKQPLMHACVTAQSVAEVISGWTGIPVGKMQADEINAVLLLKEKLEERVVGQSHAVEAIAQRIRTSRANLTDPRRPIGVFLLVGPSGVGKTESALALADALYGGERNLITINMSEFQEAHTVSSLKGSPPGYVGYGEGGVLTEAVRRKPYSVVLLDEVEKAHPDVMELFYQVFDKGTLEDGEGREIDFKNTVILLTSNAGSDIIMKLAADPETRPDPDGMLEALRPELLKVFKPALLGRMVVVPYSPITDDVMKSIIMLQLARIGRRLAENHGAVFSYDEAVVNEIASRCKEVESGARNVDHILTRTLLPEMSAEFLARMASGQAITSARVSLDDHGGFSYAIS
jgi:type VI secretion system protein VasG